MNFSMVAYILGWIMEFQAGFMLIPCIASLIYRESDGLYFVCIAIALALIGGLLIIKKPQNRRLRAREGFAMVSFAWIILTLTGALPYRLSGAIPNYIDCIFETISGYTTTGASILTDAGTLSHTMHLWHCFTIWIGGMGILVFMLAVLPLAGGESIHIMRAESAGPNVSKMLPKMRDTAMVLYFIYIALTIIEMIVLLITKIPLFDSICLSLSNAGTGGFATLSDGTMSYNATQQIVLTVFMILFAVNFSIYFLIITGRGKEIFKNEELRVFLVLVLAASLLIAYNIRGAMPETYTSFGEALRHSAFQVASVMSTTGFASCDFNLWPTLSKTLLVCLMFVGACAGSTCGGIKISRYIILWKGFKKDIESFVHPQTVRTMKLDGKKITEGQVKGVSTYMFAYLLVFAGSILLFSAQGNTTLTENFTAISTCLNNVGPGLGSIGPASNFSALTGFQKLLLSFDMLIGRLELYPILVLLLPATWKKN